MREVQRGRESLHIEYRSGRSALDDSDAKIVSMLEKAPFESTLNVDHATVLNHEQEKMELASYYLQWMPHLLADKLRAKGRESAGLIVGCLEAASRDGREHSVTGDEP
jgi:ribose 1,5-bisphosphokinase PhnN